jgi:hypothetical protein
MLRYIRSQYNSYKYARDYPLKACSLNVTISEVFLLESAYFGHLSSTRYDILVLNKLSYLLDNLT